MLNSYKFHLQLRPGATAPKTGIIGMRYYQFTGNTTRSLAPFWTGLGSYVDFGDEKNVTINGPVSNPTTTVNETTVDGNYYEQKAVEGDDYVPVKRYTVNHTYSTTSVPVKHTITVYHTDQKGTVAFYDEGNFSGPNQFGDLKGYFPQKLCEMLFYDTRDSTINTTDSIRNFSQINTIQSVEFNGVTVPLYITDLEIFLPIMA